MLTVQRWLSGSPPSALVSKPGKKISILSCFFVIVYKEVLINYANCAVKKKWLLPAPCLNIKYEYKWGVVALLFWIINRFGVKVLRVRFPFYQAFRGRVRRSSRLNSQRWSTWSWPKDGAKWFSVRTWGNRSVHRTRFFRSAPSNRGKTKETLKKSHNFVFIQAF